MKLWTVQAPEAWSIIERFGTFTARWDRIDQDFLAAYQWMAAQMERRGIALNGHAPVWAWRSYNPPHRDRPDLRRAGHAPRGAQSVLIELDLPDALALVSDFDAWHAVLNGWFLSLSEAEETEHERAKRSQDMIVQSWERIFDLSSGDPAWRRRPTERPLQATLARIDRNWVRSTLEFTAR